MSALPTPEIPPPDTSDAAGLSHRAAPARERFGPSASATVRLCLVDPAAGADEIVTAAVSLITTTYTLPGHRIMLVDSGAPAPTSQQRRDRLVESVLRLGRGATTAPDHRLQGDHESDTSVRGLSGIIPGAGLGPRHDHPAESVAIQTARQPVSEAAGPGPDGFELIIAGWSDSPVQSFALADWAPHLTPTGALVVLTHSNDQYRARTAHSRLLSGAASLAELILTDRLILAHQRPSASQPASERGRRAIALGGHRRIHTTASVFRRSAPYPEVSHA